MKVGLVVAAVWWGTTAKSVVAPFKTKTNSTCTCRFTAPATSLAPCVVTSDFDPEPTPYNTSNPVTVEGAVGPGMRDSKFMNMRQVKATCSRT